MHMVCTISSTQWDKICTYTEVCEPNVKRKTERKPRGEKKMQNTPMALARHNVNFSVFGVTSVLN